MNEILKLEYSTCIDLIKFYDAKSAELLKFAVGISTAVPTLLFGFYKLGEESTKFFWDFTFFISSFSAIGLLLIFISLIQNRLYFVYPARQANAIRSVFMDKISNEFDANQMYTKKDFSTFKLLSTHTLSNLFIAIQCGFFISLTSFSLFIHTESQRSAIIFSITIGLISIIFIFGLGALYLIKNNKLSADASVHHKK